MNLIRHFLLLTLTVYLSSLNANTSVQWNLAMNWTSTLSPISSTSFKMAEMVKKMSNGKFIIKVDGLEKLSKPTNLLTQVQNNEYNIIYTSSQKWKKHDINTIWFTGIPFGMTATEYYTWFYYGNGKKYMTMVYDKLNLLSYPAGNLGSLSGGWFRKEIKDIDDFKNLQINSQGITADIFSIYGANIKNIPPHKIDEKYKEKKLDVISGTSPSMDIKLGYHKLTPYFYTSWDKPSYQMQFLINKKAFNKLSKHYQAILQIAMKTASHELYYENFNTSAKAWEKIQKDYPNIQVKSLPNEVLHKFKKSKEILFQSYANENKLFKEIYEDQKQFLKHIRDWTKLQEYRYIKTTTTN